MTSTRFNNSKGEYCLEQSSNRKITDINTNRTSLLSDKSLPGLGVNYGKFGIDYNNNFLVNNPADVESSLFGIGSTNLVNPKGPVYADTNTIKNLPFFDPHSYSEKIMPNPLIIEGNQRPVIFRR